MMDGNPSVLMSPHNRHKGSGFQDFKIDVVEMKYLRLLFRIRRVNSATLEIKHGHGIRVTDYLSSASP